MPACARHATVRRALWLACIVLLLVPRGSRAAGTFRTVEEDGLRIVIDAEWGMKLGPGYLPVRLDITNLADARTIWIVGSDPRGALYGVGQLLRQVRWSKGALDLDAPLDISTAPAFPIRGHQLGYRAAANSWDAWTVAQFEGSCTSSISCETSFGFVSSAQREALNRGPMPVAASARSRPRRLLPVAIASRCCPFSSFSRSSMPAKRPIVSSRARKCF